MIRKLTRKIRSEVYICFVCNEAFIYVIIYYYDITA